METLTTATSPPAIAPPPATVPPVTAQPIPVQPITVQPTLYAVLADGLGSLVDLVADTDRLATSALAARAEMIDDARRFCDASIAVTTSEGMAPWSRKETARRTLTSELAAALRLPEGTVSRLVEESRVLVHELPSTLAALQHATISYRHASVIIDHASSLPEESRHPFEDAVLPFAVTHTAAQTDRKARTVRERWNPETIEARHTKAAGDRSLTWEPARDGMGYLSLYVPATTGLAIYHRATQAAIGQQGPTETRTLTQLRADAAACALLGELAGEEVVGHPGVNIHPTIALTVPVLALLGHSDEPATLEGYGPIDVATAKRLVGQAKSFIRVLTHPETGARLSVGRHRYRVPKDLETVLRMDDETCRHPGCNRAAMFCDVDHTEEWQLGGETRDVNLAHLCPSHHSLKHHSRWTMEQLDGRDIRWTSPGGKTYLTEPGSRTA
jgi:hypothetical protein